MMASFRAVWANPYVRVALTVLAAIGLLLLLRATQMVWSTLLLAFLVAYLLSPVVARLERRGTHRGVGVAAATLVFLALLAGLWVLGTAIAAQVTAFAEEVPRLVDALEELPFRLGRLVDPSLGAVFQQVYMTSQVAAGALANEVLPSIEGVGEGGLVEALAGLGGVGMQIVLVMVLSLYLLYRYPVYAASLLEASPARYRDALRELGDKADRSVGGYIRGQLLISAAVGVLAGIGLTALGIPLAAALAVLAAVFNVIPFFGPIVVAVPTAMMALTVSVGHAVSALLVLFLVNQVDAHVLTPLIYSRTISLDPVTIVVSILLGLVLFGLVGALVAVPLAAFLKLLYRDHYLSSRWYDAETGATVRRSD